MEEAVNKIKEKSKETVRPLWLRLHSSRAWRRCLKLFREKVSGHRDPVGFCVGLPKTGTQSIAFMLRGALRSSHAPEVWILTYILESISRSGNGFEGEAQDILKARHYLLDLDFESNWTLGLNIESLYDTFPESKYILTVRDPISWVNSEINQQYIFYNTEPWDILSDYRYGKMNYFEEEEKGLKENGLYPLSKYFAYWKRHIKMVEKFVPKEDLLVLRTRNISDRTTDIAKFLGISNKILNEEKSHSHRRKKKPLNITHLAEYEYVLKEANKHCENICERLFSAPIHSLHNIRINH